MQGGGGNQIVDTKAGCKHQQHEAADGKKHLFNGNYFKSEKCYKTKEKYLFPYSRSSEITHWSLTFLQQVAANNPPW